MNSDFPSHRNRGPKPAPVAVLASEAHLAQLRAPGGELECFSVLAGLHERFAELVAASAKFTGGSDEVAMHHLRQSRGLPVLADAKLLKAACAALEVLLAKTSP